MKTLFNLVHDILMFFSEITGFSYKEVNIIIWYLLIPFSWAYLLDKIINKHYFKIGITILTIATLIVIENFSQFCNWLFDLSANFLRSFNALGSNYTISSVLICIFIPLTIYIILIKKAFFQKPKLKTITATED